METIQSRSWSVVINNPTEEDIKSFEILPYNYLCYSLEHLNEGTPHIQGYIYNKSPIKLKTLKNKLIRAHLEKAKKSPLANIRYCEKEANGTFWEKGIRPLSVAKADAKNDFKPLNFEDVMDIGKMDCSKKTMDNLLASRYFTGIQLQMKIHKEILEDKLKKPKVIYYFGDSGTGKTYNALKYAIENYGIENVSKISFANGFANCTNPHAKCLVYDEFRPSQIDAATFLTLTDAYGIQLNIKHSFVFIRPKCVIITSIKHPDEIYKEEINLQFKRRITQFINMNENPYREKEEVEEIHSNENEKMEEEKRNEENININIDRAINKYLYAAEGFKPQSTAKA